MKDQIYKLNTQYSNPHTVEENLPSNIVNISRYTSNHLSNTRFEIIKKAVLFLLTIY